MPSEVQIPLRNLQQVLKSDNLNDRCAAHDLQSQTASKFDQLDAIPPGVPYTFMFGKLCILNQTTSQGNEWLSIDWPAEKPLPPEIKMGFVYVKNTERQNYVRTSVKEGNQWRWTSVEEIEKDTKAKDRSTGNPEWEFVDYFPPEIYGRDRAAGLNHTLNHRGYAVFGYSEDDEKPLPETLSAVTLQPQHIDQTTFFQVLVYDPARAKVEIIKWSQAPDYIDDRMKENGWNLIDSNVAGGIYVRTIGSPSES